MAEYFTFFPDVKHTNEIIKNITLRARIHDYIRGNPRVFLPYVVEGDLRPEDVALHYYGSTRHTWLVYLSNDIIDPYHDWVMNNTDLTKYIIRKYEECALLYYRNNGYPTMDKPTDLQILAFTQNATINENIVEYRRYDNEDISISPDSYQFIPVFIPEDNDPVTLVITSRADGTPLQYGDVYENTVVGEKYYWDHTTWKLVTNVNYTPQYYFSGTENPIIVTDSRPDGSPLQNGDVFKNTSTQNNFIWNGTQWVDNRIPYFNQQMVHSDWYPIRYYDWEFEQNENRRHVELIDRQYLSEIIDQLKVKINE